MNTSVHFIILTLIVNFLYIFPLSARSYIHIVGSSAIYPFAIAVAETFHQKKQLPTPIVESTGTGGGIKLFCNRLGQRSPDIVLASRPMTIQEKSYCQMRHVDDILEIVLGYDGIVIATPDAKIPFSLTRDQLYKALAHEIEHQPNHHLYWSDISKHFPKRKILLLGPSSASGTHEAFSQLIMKNNSEIRHDDVYNEASDQETVLLQKLQFQSEALGLFSLSFAILNSDKITPLEIEGVKPSFKTIMSGAYPLSRPLYLYVKKAHFSLIPGLDHFIKEFISIEASGLKGYLTSFGFIPQPEDKRFKEEMKLNKALNLDRKNNLK